MNLRGQKGPEHLSYLDTPRNHQYNECAPLKEKLSPVNLKGKESMRKLLAVLVVWTMLMLMAVPASAQCGRYRHRHSNVTHTHRSCIGDGHKHGRSFWQKHRDKLTTAGGAGAGALIGGIAGGKKGALIGAAVGGGGAAVYTYGIRKRRRSARY